MKHIARVKVVSRDCPVRSDADADGTLPGARACPRSIERGDDAVCRPHEAVTHIARVIVVSRDRPIGRVSIVPSNRSTRVDAKSEGARAYWDLCPRGDIGQYALLLLAQSSAGHDLLRPLKRIRIKKSARFVTSFLRDPKRRNLLALGRQD